MPQTLGQIVYLFKDNRSSAMDRTSCHTENMANRLRKEDVARLPVKWRPPPPSKFKKAFLARIKLAREGAGLTQVQMAERLGIPQDKYSKYEVRSFMPHELLSKFSEITGESLEKLLRDGHELKRGNGSDV